MQSDLFAHPDGLSEVGDDGSVTLFARRALDTGDWSQDYLVPLDQEFSIGYAFNDYSDFVSDYTPHFLQGNTTVTLSSDGAWALGQDSESYG